MFRVSVLGLATLLTVGASGSAVAELGVCCLGTGVCIIATEEECLAHPEFCFWEETWDTCDPNPCPNSGCDHACCFDDGSCETFEDPDDCLAAGGVVVGYACEPNRCVTAVSACCFLDGHCELLGYIDCRYAEDSYAWHSLGTTCDPNPCSTPLYACCFADGSCVMETEWDCLELGGSPQGTWTDCIPNLCIPTTTSAATWGKLKTTYR